MKSDPTLILLTGPTAVGKTKAAIQLSQELNAPIISADSRQVYKELEIGVAKPDADELDAAPHHLISHVSIHQGYSVAHWLNDAKNVIKETNSLFVIITGGTGLYFNALLNGLDQLPPVDESLRKQLDKRLKQRGLDDLSRELLRLDPGASDHVELDNPRRVLRALEIVTQTGKTLSQVYGNRVPGVTNPTISIGLSMDREQLYERINNRVDTMMTTGLEEEARSLFDFRHRQALQTVGYTEFFDCFSGRTERGAAIELIKRNTRRYAKRQLTWFRNQMDCTWFEPHQYEAMLTYIESV